MNAIKELRAAKKALDAWNAATEVERVAARKVAFAAQIFVLGRMDRAELAKWVEAHVAAENAMDAACTAYKATYSEKTAY